MARENWFVAFPIRSDVVGPLPAAPPGLRRYHVDDLHLTLAFLGACGEPAALQSLGVLDELLQRDRPTPWDVTLGQVVPMGSRRAYSALSALLEHGREATEARILAWRDALTETAVGRREKRPPKAHITLARPRYRATESQRAAGLAWAEQLDLRDVKATLDSIALYRWDPLRRERLFRIVAERRLRSDESVHSCS